MAIAEAGRGSVNDITIAHLTKTFPGQRALDDVSFTISAGEVHGLIGENGSGKSTLIKTLAGVQKPDPGGLVTIGGEQLRFGSSFESQRLGIRCVYQDLGLIGSLTVLENIALTAGYQRRWGRAIDWKAERRRARELLGRLHMSLDLDARAEELTSVERAVLAIARSLDERQGEVRLLMLDEPTAALAPSEVEVLFDVLRKLVEHGVAIMYVSHRLDEVLSLVGEMTVLRNGEVVARHDQVSTLSRHDVARLMVGSGDEWSRADRPVASGPKEVVLSARDLRSSVLDGVSFDLRANESIGFAGLTGAGHVEAAYAVYQSPAEGSGEIAMGDRRVSSTNPRLSQQLGVALVPGNRQAGSAITEMTLLENFEMPVTRRERRRADTRKLAEEMIRTLDVRPGELDRPFGTFSGGNQQKILLGKWLSLGPKVLIVDEPTAGVDVGARQAIRREIARAATEGMSVVVVSSDLEDLTILCDRVLVFRRGVVVGELSGAEITEANIMAEISSNADIVGKDLSA